MFDLARREAEAIVNEAREQASRLIEAAKKKESSGELETDAEREAAKEFADSIDRAIRQLTEVLEELRQQIDK